MSVVVSLQSKVCRKCREVKLFSEFGKQKLGKLGYRSNCKVCKLDVDIKYRAENPEKRKESCAKYYAANPEKIKERNAKHYAANPEKKKEYGANYRAANPEKEKERHAKYCADNPEKGRANGAKRRAAKLLAIPFWLTEDDYKAMEAIYAEAKRLEAETGLIYHVDHIHPLQGKLVCGLHCPENLQILTEAENCSKGNKFTPYVESDLIS